MKICLTDVFPNGAILKREYKPRSYSLYLIHFAFNDGKAIEMVRLKDEASLDEAYRFWSGQLALGYTPAHLKGYDGKVYERRWIPLEIEEPDIDPDLDLDFLP